MADGIGRAGRDEVCAATTSMTGPFSACIRISPPFSAVCAKGLEDGAVVAQEDARVGGEELEARHAFLDEASISGSTSSRMSETMQWNP